ncbi:hypothetical protein HPC38_07655 [Pasteurellaceae bacterium HPA106]|uniref:hypothetical protein n=1 Tax=Spirabiliibacterium pneumoniae TaxID=221400 RepID=UPI001AADD013|nr:hypothetical protein [Spirabiliibacterium pneumoniae]MBE2896747.1 hypothetical protein [Spirabiliibacterium pneumoniae]
MFLQGTDVMFCIYDLFYSRKWLVLNEREKQLPLDPNAEKEAVMFLYTLDQQTEETWKSLTPNQRATINGLLIDFMARASTSSKTWTVSDDISPSEQAIEIIKHEIFLSHNSLVISN